VKLKGVSKTVHQPLLATSWDGLREVTKRPTVGSTQISAMTTITTCSAVLERMGFDRFIIASLAVL
jgi:hypothetical protein